MPCMPVNTLQAFALAKSLIDPSIPLIMNHLSSDLVLYIEP